MKAISEEYFGKKALVSTTPITTALVDLPIVEVKDPKGPSTIAEHSGATLKGNGI
jgi:hypothetical protein